MTITPRIMALTRAVLLTMAVGGCTTAPKSSATVAAGAQPPEATVKRFQNNSLEGRSAVESALELSEKYAKLSDQTVTLRQENQRLATDNENLRQQITSLESKLKQTQKELSEANDLLIEMLTELNNWKSNILGFRGEMRQAAQAQLEALLKVLEILGGQAEAGAIERKHAGTLNQDVNDMKPAGKSATPLRREPNAAQ